VVFHHKRRNVEDEPLTCTNDSPTAADDEEQTCCAWMDNIASLDDFFAASHLSYGVDQFRERLWNLLVYEHEQQQQQQHDDACDAGWVENPCTNPGFTTEWQGYTLLGTGDAEECQQQVLRLIPHPELVTDLTNDDDDNERIMVAGVEHPPVTGRFVAMSLYFFTLDSLRELSGHEELNANWPTPSLAELEHALPGLCGRDWHSDLQHQQHRFTRPQVLPLRCFESVYMVALLKSFGFDPMSRDITFAYEVNESEVEWTLGMALSMRASGTAAASATNNLEENGARSCERSTEEEESLYDNDERSRAASSTQT